MGLTDFRSTACKHYWKWDVTYRYRHIELIWRLSMVQYLQNNVIMKWTTRFTSFNGWIPLKYGSTATPPIIAHDQNLWCQASNFTLRSPKTSNIRRTPSFDLLTDEFSKRVSIIRRAPYTVDSRYLAPVGSQNSRARVKWFSRYLALSREGHHSRIQNHRHTLPAVYNSQTVCWAIIQVLTFPGSLHTSTSHQRQITTSNIRF